jgi:hypothetical protein
MVPWPENGDYPLKESRNRMTEDPSLSLSLFDVLFSFK